MRDLTLTPAFAAPGNYEVSAWVEDRPGIDAPPKGNGRAMQIDVKAGKTAVVLLACFVPTALPHSERQQFP